MRRRHNRLADRMSPRLRLLTMRIVYTNTMDDCLAFARFAMERSPTFQQRKWLSLLWGTFQALAAVLLSHYLFQIPPRLLLMLYLGTVAGFLLLFHIRYGRALTARAEQIYREAANRAILCEHELNLDDEGVTARTTMTESRHAWQAIERVDETAEYGFIYTSAVTAHMIPKRFVMEGDGTQFVAEAKRIWLATHTSLPNVRLTGSR